MDDLPPIRAQLSRLGLRADKRLGQHFLFDLNLTRRIAGAAGPFEGVNVIEIGPGPGGLTRALLEQPLARLTVIERDQRCVPILQELADRDSRLDIAIADALHSQAAALTPPPRKLVANLPYNVATKLLLLWSESPADFVSLTVLLQKEVADRLTALPRTKAYGRLTIIVQWLYEIRREFDIPAAAFTPPPRVTSTLVTLMPRQQPLAIAPRDVLQDVTRAAFGQRRKTLRAALKQLGPRAAPAMAAAGIDSGCRAEELSVEQFCALARAYAAATETGPSGPDAAA